MKKNKLKIIFKKALTLIVILLLIPATSSTFSENILNNFFAKLSTTNHDENISPKTGGLNFSPPHDTNSDNSKEKQEIEEQDDLRVMQPKHSLGTYKSYTSVTADQEIITKGETIELSSYTEWEIIGLQPVSQGSVYWYDLYTLTTDSDPVSSTISSEIIAVKFSFPFDSTFAALSLNYSTIASTISEDYVNVYLTTDLENYLSNYQYKGMITQHYISTQKDTSDSPLVFATYNFPGSDSFDNTLSAETSYYIVIHSSSGLVLQTSNDTNGVDENTVYSYDSSIGWTEQLGIDLQCTIYTSNNAEPIYMSETSDGATSFMYDSSNSIFADHRFLGLYYDEEYLLDMSSDFVDALVTDSLEAYYLTLTSPAKAEYSDQITLSAKLENIDNAPLSGYNVSFAYSEDQSAWYSLGIATTDAFGIASINYAIEDIGVIYFKAVHKMLVDYSSTNRTKEKVIVWAPIANATYGSKTSSSTETRIPLITQVTDNDGEPFVNLMVYFYIEGKMGIYTFTNGSGYAEINNQYVNWDAGTYINAYWLHIDLNDDLYDYKINTYGDIKIKPSTIIFSSESDTYHFAFNTAFNFSGHFGDYQNDSIGGVEYELELIDSNDVHMNLGSYYTNSNGVFTVSFSENLLMSDEYTLRFKVFDDNYEYFEQDVTLIVNPGEAYIHLDPQLDSAENYLYNDTIVVTILVTDKYMNSLSGIEVMLQLSYVNNLQIVEHSYIKVTNSSGYVTFTLNFDLEIDDQIKVTIFSRPYEEDGTTLYSQSDCHFTTFTCIQGSAIFKDLQDYNTTNQETIFITGKLYSDASTPLENEIVTIEIDGEIFELLTDSEGIFNLTYLVYKGTTLTINYSFNNTNYEYIEDHTYIYSSPIDVSIEMDDAQGVTDELLTLTVRVNSSLGTYPTGITVQFYWHNGETWQHLSNKQTNETGYAVLKIVCSLERGEYQWRAKIIDDDNWIGDVKERNLQIGYYTSINLASNKQEYNYTENIMFEIYTYDENNQTISVLVTIYINGTELDQITTDTNGYYLYSISDDLFPNYYILTAVIEDTSIYFPSEQSLEFSITKTTSQLDVNDLTVLYGQACELPIYLYSSFGSISEATIKIYETDALIGTIFTNSSGWAVFIIDGTYDVGTYLLTISFEETEGYLGSSEIITLTVKKESLVLSIQADNSTYSEVNTISGYLKTAESVSLHNYTIYLEIDNEIKSCLTDEQGYYEFHIDDLLPGTYEIKVYVEESENYLYAENSASITVTKISTNIILSTEFEYNYTDTIDLEIYTYDEFNANISISVNLYVNDSLYDQILTDENGYYHYSIVFDFDPSVYTFRLVILEDDYYLSSETEQIITVKKHASFIDASDITVVYGESYELISYLYSALGPIENAEITITEDDIALVNCLTNTSGYAIIDIINLNLEVGVYTLVLVYEGSDYFLSSTASITVTVTKASLSLSIEANDAVYNETSIISGYLHSDSSYSIDGIAIYLQINGTETDVYTINETGYYEFIIELLPGSYECVVYVPESANYHYVEVSATITISKIDTSLVISTDSQEYNYTESITAEISVTDENNQTISEMLVDLYLNGIFWDQVITDVNGSYLLVFQEELLPGNYIIEAKLVENELYEVSQNATSFEVFKLPSIIEAEDVIVVYGDDAYVEIFVYSSLGVVADGEINIYANDILLISSTTNSSGYLTTNLGNDFDVGTHVLSIVYEGSETILDATLQINLIVQKQTFTLTLTVNDGVYGSEILVSGYLKDQHLQPVENVTIYLLINGTQIETSQTASNGYYEFHVNDILPGAYEIKVYVEETSTYKYIQNTKTITIYKIQTAINGTFTFINDTIEIAATLTDASSSPIADELLKLYINNTWILDALTNASGMAIFTHDLAPGYYIFTIIFEETTIYEDSSITMSGEQDKFPTELKTTINEGTYVTEPTIFYTTLTSFNDPIANKQIELMVGEQVYFALTNASGIAKFNLDIYLTPGKYDYTIYFAGDDEYSQNSLEGQFTVKKAETFIFLEFSYVSNLPLLNGQIVSEVLLENITISIYANDTFYDTVLTDSNGYFSTNIILSEGIYTLEVIFAGNTYFLASVEQLTVDIYKIITSLTSEVSSINNTYGEDIVTQLHLSDINGNNLTETDLLIKINGVYYKTITTDSNGIGTLTLTAEELIGGNYLITCFYQGNVSHSQSTYEINLSVYYSLEFESLDINGRTYGEDFSIEGQFNSFDGLLPEVAVNIRINETSYIVTTSMSRFILTLDQYLEAGYYEITITVDQTELLLAYSTITEYERDLGTPALHLDITEQQYNNIVPLNGTFSFLTLNLTDSKVTIYIEDELIGIVKTDASGYFIIPSSFLMDYEPETYNLTLIVTSNNKNLDSIKQTYDLTIVKGDIIIEFLHLNGTNYKDILEIEITLKDTMSNSLVDYTIELTIGDDQYYLTTDQEGKLFFSWNITLMEPILSIKGEATDLYQEISFEYAFNFEKDATWFYHNLESAKYKQDQQLTIMLYSNNSFYLANVSFNLIIDEVSYSINGSINIDLAEFEGGNYSISANFSGNQFYNPAYLVFILEIKPLDTALSIEIVETKAYISLTDAYNESLDDQLITIMLKSENNSIIYEFFLSTDQDGQVFLDLSKLEMHDVKQIAVIFTGDKNHKGAACSIEYEYEQIMIHKNDNLINLLAPIVSSAALGIALGVRQIMALNKGADLMKKMRFFKQ